MDLIIKELVTNYVVPLLVPLVAGLLMALIANASKWVKANLSLKQQELIETVVAQGVSASEMLWANPQTRAYIVSKKDEAFSFISDKLAKAKVPFTADELYSLIEAEVLKLKWEGSEIKDKPVV